MATLAIASIGATSNSSATTSQSSGALTAPGLLIAHCVMDNGVPAESFATPLATGLTFTKRCESVHSGCLQVWTAPVLSSGTYSVSCARGSGTATVPKRLHLSYATQSDGGMPAIGHTLADNSDAHGGSACTSLAITATAAGSFGCALCVPTASVPTDVSGQTSLDKDAGVTFGGGGNEGVATYKLNAISTGATTLTLTMPTGGAWELVDFEVMLGPPPSGGTNHGAAFFELV